MARLRRIFDTRLVAGKMDSGAAPPNSYLLSALLKPRSQVVYRERGLGEGAEGEGQKRQLVVVAGDAVGAQRAAAGAAMDEGPLAIIADRDADRLHGLGAGAAAVAGLLIDVTRPQALGAMIAMTRAVGLRRHLAAAVNASELFHVGT